MHSECELCDKERPCFAVARRFSLLSKAVPSRIKLATRAIMYASWKLALHTTVMWERLQNIDLSKEQRKVDRELAGIFIHSHHARARLWCGSAENWSYDFFSSSEWKGIKTSPCLPNCCIVTIKALDCCGVIQMNTRSCMKMWLCVCAQVTSRAGVLVGFLHFGTEPRMCLVSQLRIVSEWVSCYLNTIASAFCVSHMSLHGVTDGFWLPRFCITACYAILTIITTVSSPRTSGVCLFLLSNVN